MFACAITGLLATGQELKTNFIYDDARPYEVRLQSATGNDIVFARDLMSQAFASVGRVGEGHIRPLVNSLYFFLAIQTGTGFEGWVKICYPRDEVDSFLDQTYDLVPFGTEKMDIDALLQDFYDDKI